MLFRSGYVPVSRDIEYVRHRKLPLTTAVEDTAYLAASAAKGRRIFMDGFTYHNWGGCRTALERRFIFVPAASYRVGALHLFELHPRAEHSPSS